MNQVDILKQFFNFLSHVQGPAARLGIRDQDSTALKIKMLSVQCENFPLRLPV